MVWVCTGSFRGVRDQPVTGHERSISRACVTFGRIRRVFGGSHGAVGAVRADGAAVTGDQQLLAAGLAAEHALADRATSMTVHAFGAPEPAPSPLGPAGLLAGTSLGGSGWRGWSG